MTASPLAQLFPRRARADFVGDARLVAAVRQGLILDAQAVYTTYAPYLYLSHLESLSLNMTYDL
jgi:hypothetical protein